MNPFTKIRLRRMIMGILSGALVIMLSICCVIAFKTAKKKQMYYVPEHDGNTLCGIPKQNDIEVIFPKEGMQIGFSVPAIYTENKLYINLINYEANDFYLSVLLFDDSRKFMADSGLIDCGEYLPYLVTDKKLDINKEYLLKVVAYHKDKMTNEGAVWIRVVVTEG